MGIIPHEFVLGFPKVCQMVFLMSVFVHFALPYFQSVRRLRLGRRVTSAYVNAHRWQHYMLNVGTDVCLQLRMIKHTTLNLDTELVNRARQVLGTKTITETIKQALEDVVRRDAMRCLAEQNFSELIEELPKLRAPRRFEES
jgi:Arc/MetJ family transcription regulator